MMKSFNIASYMRKQVREITLKLFFYGSSQLFLKTFMSYSYVFAFLTERLLAFVCILGVNKLVRVYLAIA